MWSALRWVVGGFLTLAGIFLFWLAFSALQVNWLWPQHQATIGRCTNGHDCPVVIHTNTGDVTSIVVTTADLSGQHVVVSASGSSPWSSVQVTNSGQAWLMIVVGVIGGALCIGALWMIFRRRPVPA